MGSDDVTESQIQRMIFGQLSQMQVDIRELPRLAALMEETRAAVRKLDDRDLEKQRLLEDVRYRQNEFLAAQSVLAGSISDLQRAMETYKQRLTEVESRAGAALDVQASVNARMRKLEEGQTRHETELTEYRPWIKALKKFGLVVMAMVATAAAVWLLTGVAQSILSTVP